MQEKWTIEALTPPTCCSVLLCVLWRIVCFLSAMFFALYYQQLLEVSGMILNILVSPFSQQAPFYILFSPRRSCSQWKTPICPTVNTGLAFQDRPSNPFTFFPKKNALAGHPLQVLKNLSIHTLIPLVSSDFSNVILRYVSEWACLWQSWFPWSMLNDAGNHLTWKRSDRQQKTSTWMGSVEPKHM